MLCMLLSTSCWLAYAACSSARSVGSPGSALAAKVHESAAACLQAFLQKALMPLHKPKGLGAYQQQLSYCVTQVRTSSYRHNAVLDDTPGMLFDSMTL